MDGYRIGHELVKIIGDALGEVLILRYADLEFPAAINQRLDVGQHQRLAFPASTTRSFLSLLSNRRFLSSSYSSAPAASMQDRCLIQTETSESRADGQCPMSA